MRRQIKWLWDNMDARLHKRQILALVISAVTSALLLVNPALSQRLIDDVIVAQNPQPLLGILAVMLVVKLGREASRYLMVILLEGNSQNVLFHHRVEIFKCLVKSHLPGNQCCPWPTTSTSKICYILKLQIILLNLNRITFKQFLQTDSSGRFS